MRVKIAYIDGVTEEVNNIPTEEIAAGIYAEACGNSRVLSAELTRGDGSHAAAYRFDDVMPEPGLTRPGDCG